MVSTWSDNKSSESESDEHTANICLMAKEVQGDKQTEYGSSDEADVSLL